MGSLADRLASPNRPLCAGYVQRQHSLAQGQNGATPKSGILSAPSRFHEHVVCERALTISWRYIPSLLTVSAFAPHIASPAPRSRRILGEQAHRSPPAIRDAYPRACSAVSPCPVRFGVSLPLVPAQQL